MSAARQELLFAGVNLVFATGNAACAAWTWLHWYTAINVFVGAVNARYAVDDLRRYRGLVRL